jgi:hypothetical protein
VGQRIFGVRSAGAELGPLVSKPTGARNRPSSIVAAAHMASMVAGFSGPDKERSPVDAVVGSFRLLD